MIRPARRSDYGAIRAVSVATGQSGLDSGTDVDYLAYLDTAGTLLVALDAHQQLVGWGATQAVLGASMLTDLFVDPHRQGGGIGSRILRALWPQDSAPRFTFSSQHANAIPLYAKAGLQPTWPLLYLTGRPDFALDSGLQVTRVSGPAAADAERRLTGAERAAVYEYWTSGPNATGLVINAGDRLVACGIVRPHAITHLACASVDDALATVQAALSAIGTDTVSVCLPGPHPAVPALLRNGFRIDDYDLAMSTQAVNLPTTWAYSPSLG